MTLVFEISRVNCNFLFTGEQVTSATYKMHGVRKYLDHCIAEKGEKSSETLSMKRLYKHLLSNVCDVVEENKEGIVVLYCINSNLTL